MRSDRYFILIGCLWLTASTALAAGNVPESYQATRYEPLWKRSPFTLSSITEDQGPTSAITERFSLVAAYTIGEADYVVVVNKTNPQERLLITKAANAQGVSLVSVNYNAATPEKSSAVIKQGDESGPVNFDPALLKAASVAAAPTPMPQPGRPAAMPTYTPGQPASPARMIRRARIIAPPPGTPSSTPTPPPTRP